MLSFFVNLFNTKIKKMHHNNFTVHLLEKNKERKNYLRPSGPQLKSKLLKNFE